MVFSRTSPSVLSGRKAVLTFSLPRIRLILSKPSLTYEIEAKAVVPPEVSNCVSLSFSSLALSMPGTH